VYSRAYIVQGEKWEPPVGTLNYDFVNFKDINTIILTMSRDGKKNDYQEIILKKQSGSSYQSIGSDWGYKIEIIQQSDGKLKLIMRSTEDATTVITLLLRK
jgi:hypothetical protein